MATSQWMRRPRRSSRNRSCTKDPKDFRYIGKGQDQHRRSARHHHRPGNLMAADTRLPGLKYAVIARPPVVGGKVVSFDAKMPWRCPAWRR